MVDGEAPLLKLVVVKGPLSGRVIESKTRSKIHIGRVVRGNTVAIKDTGISTKHLTIQFERGSGRWTVTDLDSSNGSVLNSVSLKPSTPYSLSDGDVINIGEMTVMEVKLDIESTGKIFKEEDSRPRRVSRRRGVVEGGQLGIIDENSELRVKVDEELGEKDNGVSRGRRGRVSKIQNSGSGGEQLENVGEKDVNKENQVVSIRRTRSSKKMENLENAEELQNVPPKRDLRSEKGEESEDPVNMVMEKASLKRTRRKKEEKVEANEEKGYRMSLRRTRSSIIAENVGEVTNLEMVESRKTRKGTREKKNLSIDLSEKMVEKINLIEEKNVNKMKEDLNVASISEVKESNANLDVVKGRKTRKSRRNLSTKASEKVEKLDSINEEVETKLDVNMSEVKENTKDVVQVQGRKTRKGTMEKRILAVKASEVKENNDNSVKGRRTRKSTKENKDLSIKSSGKKVEKLDLIEEDEVKIKENELMGNTHMKEGTQTRKRMREKNDLSVEIVEGRRTRQRTREKRDLSVNNISCDIVDENIKKDEANEFEKGKNVDLASTSKVKCKNDGLDFEKKMSLGDWLRRGGSKQNNGKIEDDMTGGFMLQTKGKAQSFWVKW